MDWLSQSTTRDVQPPFLRNECLCCIPYLTARAYLRQRPADMLETARQQHNRTTGNAITRCQSNRNVKDEMAGTLDTGKKTGKKYSPTQNTMERLAQRVSGVMMVFAGYPL